MLLIKPLSVLLIGIKINLCYKVNLDKNYTKIFLVAWSVVRCVIKLVVNQSASNGYDLLWEKNVFYVLDCWLPNHFRRCTYENAANRLLQTVNLLIGGHSYILTRIIHGTLFLSYPTATCEDPSQLDSWKAIITK